MIIRLYYICSKQWSASRRDPRVTGHGKNRHVSTSQFRRLDKAETSVCCLRDHQDGHCSVSWTRGEPLSGVMWRCAEEDNRSTITPLVFMPMYYPRPEGASYEGRLLRAASAGRANAILRALL